MALQIFPHGFKGCDVSAISIELPGFSGERCLIVSFYKPPDICFSCQNWSDVFAKLNMLTLPNSCLIVGDFNSQQSCWGSSRPNTSEMSLNDFLLTSDFYILNNGTGTRMSANRFHVSYPDLSLFNSSLITLNWNVMDDPMGSDHLPIIISTEPVKYIYNNSNRYKERPKLLLNQMDKKVFGLLVSGKLFCAPTGNNGAENYLWWHNSIIECALMAGAFIRNEQGQTLKWDPEIGIVPQQHKGKKKIRISKPWWDSDCQKAVEDRKQCYRKLISCPCSFHLREYRRSSNFVTLLKRGKKLIFRIL